MCGITAMLGLNGRDASRTVIDRMTSAIVHRGPDDMGTYFRGPVGFGFRRLSILDLSADGHQPMISRVADVTIVFNGEIFNYVELREELAACGFTFRSSGDTEVLLTAYVHWGVACVEKLNGMFAFIIHDQRTGELFGARDHMGIKPLYLYRTPEAVLLASEIKAIRASSLYQHSVNWSVASKYLLECRLDDSVETFFAGVEHLPPGHAFTLGGSGELRAWRYWDLPDTSLVPVPDAPERIADLLEDSVRLRMRSDVPVGVCLSGGLDSTAIICAMARQRGQARPLSSGPLLAFSFSAKEFDESRYIRDTIEQTAAILTPLQSDENTLWDSMGRILWFQDEPVHSMAAVVGFALMGLAARHATKVVLNGQGSDETLGGYSSYFQAYWYSLAAQGRPLKAWQEISSYADAHNAGRLALTLQVLRRTGFGAIGRAPGYRSVARWARQSLVSRNPWFTDTLHESFDRGNSPGATTLDMALRRSVKSSPLPLYLRIEDRNSMAHSVEARLPFLDHRLVSLAFQLPMEWKVHGPWNKFGLREALTGRIPESVRSRVDKMGFPVPGKSWFANRLFEPLRDILSSRAAAERGIYRTDRLLRDLERHRRGEIDMTPVLFRVAQFELWAAMAEAPLPLVASNSSLEGRLVS